MFEHMEIAKIVYETTQEESNCTGLSNKNRGEHLTHDGWELWKAP